MFTARSGYTIGESVFLLALSLVAVLSVSPYNSLLLDGQITAKWIGAGILFCITVISVQIISVCSRKDGVRSAFSIRLFAMPFLIAGLMVIVHSILQLTGIVSIQSENGFLVLAGFDNPAGVAASLTVSLPFTLALVDKVKDRVIKNVVLFGICVVVMIILTIARSRVGVLASGTVLLLYFLHTLKDIKTRKIIAVLLSLLVLSAIVFMSFSKRGSNSGRMLILSVCWDMFKDAPFFGHGLHGFRSQYMLYQANFLDQCTNNVLPILADNTTHPLNEYALLTVNFGLIGIATLLFGIILTIMHYFKNPSNESFVGMMVIAGIGVFSMFSYPFRYPLTLLGLLCALELVFMDVFMRPDKQVAFLLRAASIVMSAVGLVLLILWADLQIKWGQLYALENAGKNKKEILEEYSNLYSGLNKDPYFLYNYAYVLFENCDYRSADLIARESFGLMSNYDTALLLADNAKEYGNVDMAEEYYWLASKMCPVRFMPLYCLFCLYKDLDRIEDMREIGKVILSKPVKISSNEIRTIRSYVKQALINF